MSAEAPAESALLTIGHSTRTLPAFLNLLQRHGVEMLVDVRTIPRSRRNPQFDQETLPAELRAAGNAYRHMPELGGRRRPRSDSLNNGWRNTSFQGFADYMDTPAFDVALSALIELARQTCCAIMCAEAVPWRCHRSLIADALLVRGVPVQHILGATRAQTHLLTPWARLVAGRLSYPPADAESDRAGDEQG